ncbi:VWA domain-containing protein [Heliobacterium undosum]|uniref:VWA domain-containing protein n=1 Tax=Heliomicrobium undosum TaxID=121734 RepID=A0A845L0W5_9FIRM|nr:VWA domain-containing protein [Heliomicrobium undosum]MZP30117.1 VWA domain-containing protein [Heliomicrobium undosum]
MRYFTLFLLIACFFLNPTEGYSWGNINTHPTINEKSYDFFIDSITNSSKKYNDIKFAEIKFTGNGFDINNFTKNIGLNITEPKGLLSDRNYTMKEWLIEGGYSADIPAIDMGLRHFYDPLRKFNGTDYLTDIPGVVPNPQISAKKWALSNEWAKANDSRGSSWVKALTYYKNGMEKNDDEFFAESFRALGHTMHLVADMTQPAHVRNDGHMREEPIEDTVDTNKKYVTFASSNMQDNLLNSIFSIKESKDKGLKLENIFDLLSKYTNQNFYSDDTIYNKGDNNIDNPSILPRNKKANYDSPQFNTPGVVKGKDGISYGIRLNNDIYVPLIEEEYKSYFTRNNPTTKSYHVPIYFAREQSKYLIPLAIRANAEVINSFIPTMTLDFSVKRDERDSVLVEGLFKHHIDKDDEWKKNIGEEIKYNGMGNIIITGKDGERRIPVKFTQGYCKESIENYKKEDVIVLEVEAGGLKYRSEFSPCRKYDDLIRTKSLINQNSKYNPNRRRPVDLVIILDSSGSMKESDKNSLRKKAANYLVDELASIDRVSIVDFDDSALVRASMSNNKDALHSAIDAIDSSGGTNIGRGIEVAIKEFHKVGWIDDRSQLAILLTDGNDENGQPSVLEAQVDAAYSNWLHIYTIGLGETHNKELLSKIANDTGGEYFVVRDASLIETTFDQIALSRNINLTKDTDKDGISDWAERKGFVLLQPEDGQEIPIKPTDPYNTDSDHDGYSDKQELGDIFINSSNRELYVVGLIDGCNKYLPYSSDPNDPNKIPRSN